MIIKANINDLPLYGLEHNTNCHKRREKEKHGNNSMAVMKNQLFIPWYGKYIPSEYSKTIVTLTLTHPSRRALRVSHSTDFVGLCIFLWQDIK